MKYHTEPDYSYTVIRVPQQNAMTGLYPSFLFKINDTITLSLEMKQKTSFIFSGTFLTQRQSIIRSNKVKPGQGLFFNISTYGNQRLLNHVIKSCERMSLG